MERAAGQPLPQFAQRQLFAPLAMVDTCYWRGPDPTPPGAAPLAFPHPAPLSLGDGGVWTTASDLLRWSQALNADELGISTLMQTPGCLDDGTPIDYAWGIGVRSHAGHRVYRHGGGWPGLRAAQARIPDLDLSMVLIAVADDTERRVDLLNSLLDEVTKPGIPARWTASTADSGSAGSPPGNGLVPPSGTASVSLGAGTAVTTPH